MPELGNIALISAAVLIVLLIALYGVQVLRLVAHRRAQRERDAQIEAYLRDTDRPYDWSVDGI